MKTVEELKAELAELDAKIDAALAVKEVAAADLDVQRAAIKELRKVRAGVAQAVKLLDGITDEGLAVLKGAVDG